MKKENGFGKEKIPFLFFIMEIIYFFYFLIQVNDLKTSLSEDSAKEALLHYQDIKKMFFILFLLLLLFCFSFFYRKRNRIKEAAAYLKIIVNNIPGGYVIYHTDEKGSFIYLSRKFLDLCGYKKEELYYKLHNSFYELVYREDREKLKRELKKQSTKEEVQLEYRIISKNGNIIWVLDKREKRKQGKEAHFYCVIVDITAQKSSEQRMRALTNNINGGILIMALDHDFTVTFINDGYLRMIGYTREELKAEKNNQVFYLITEEDREAMIQDIRNQLSSGKSILQEHQLLKRNGEVIWVLLKGEKSEGEGKYQQLNCVVIDITHSKKMESYLRFNEKKYQIAMEQSNHIFFDYNRKEKTIYFSEVFAQKIGFPSKLEQVPHSLIDYEIIHKDSITEVFALFQKMEKGKRTVSCECKLRLSKDQYTWSKFTLIQVSEEDDFSEYMVGIWEDITEKKEAALHYLQEQKNREIILGTETDSFQVNFSQNKIIYGSEQWCIEYEIDSSKSYEEIMQVFAIKSVFIEDQPLFLKWFSLKNIQTAFYKGKTELSLEYRRKNKKGQYIWVLGTIYLIQDILSGELTGFIQIKNIENQKQKELNWRFKAERDSLSGFYNKGTTENLLIHFLETEGKDKVHGLFVIDVDNFKIINDSFGHVFGDNVIEKIAECIRRCIRATDIIGRIGGDEFMILLKDIPNAEFAGCKAEEICRILNQVMLPEGKTQAYISVSIGIAVYPIHGSTFQELYSNADCALYDSKKCGKNTFSFYHEKEKEEK